jgi:hypothetical protein
MALVKSLAEMLQHFSQPTITVKRKGFLNPLTNRRMYAIRVIAQVLFSRFPHMPYTSLYRRTPLPNIGRAIGFNNLSTATNFFVVLPSIVITLNPRDWRANRPNSAASQKWDRHFSPVVLHE